MILFKAEFLGHIQAATHGRFSIPSEACHAANLSSGDTIQAEIMLGAQHYRGPIQLTSGFEVLLPTSHPLYQSALPGSPIHVTISWTR